jgi:predicted alpha/beta hydrolase family esterase
MIDLDKKTVLLLHGWGGKKEHHWLTWLELTLKDQNYPVHFPKIPNNYNPNLKKWLLHIDNYVKDIQPKIVITHSLGCLAWWHYCAQTGYEANKNISVAPPTFASFQSKMKSFFPLPDPLPILHEHTIIYAKDDPNIKEDILRIWAEKMQAKVVRRKSGEHLDHFSKTQTLPEVLKFLEIRS